MRDKTIYATQGGGTAQESDTGELLFVTAPASGTGLQVGDVVPNEWGLQPISARALSRDEAFDLAEAASFGAADEARHTVNDWLSGKSIGASSLDDLRDPQDLPDSSFDDWVHGGNYRHG